MRQIFQDLREKTLFSRGSSAAREGGKGAARKDNSIYENMDKKGHFGKMSCRKIVEFPTRYSTSLRKWTRIKIQTRLLTLHPQNFPDPACAWRSAKSPRGESGDPRSYRSSFAPRSVCTLQPTLRNKKPLRSPIANLGREREREREIEEIEETVRF